MSSIVSLINSLYSASVLVNLGNAHAFVSYTPLHILGVAGILAEWREYFWLRESFGMIYWYSGKCLVHLYFFFPTLASVYWRQLSSINLLAAFVCGFMRMWKGTKGYTLKG